MNKYTHACIKPVCGNSYQGDDPDAYYCPDCAAKNKALAKEVDAKIASRPRKPTKSALQEYDEQAKIKGFVHVRL